MSINPSGIAITNLQPIPSFYAFLNKSQPPLPSSLEGYGPFVFDMICAGEYWAARERQILAPRVLARGAWDAVVVVYWMPKARPWLPSRRAGDRYPSGT